MSLSLSLMSRVTLALAIVAVAPVAIAVWSLFDLNRDGLSEQVLRTHTLAAATAAERIAAAIELRHATAAAIAANPQVTDDPKAEAATRFFEQLFISDATIQAVVITTPSNQLVIRFQQRGASTFPTSAKLVPQLREGLLAVAAPFTDGRGAVHVFSDAAPILAALNPSEIGEHAEIILSSPAGVVAGRTTLDTLPATIAKTAASAHVNGTTVYRDANGRDVMTAYAAVAGTPWFVVSRQPAAIAQRIAVQMRRRTAIAVALAVLLAALLALVAQRTVVRPIRDVVRAQQKLAGGAANVTGSEIDQLRDAAEFLERRIADQDDLGRIFLGRYQVLGLIGQGAMGTVFRGWDPKLRRALALKTVHLAEARETRAEAISSLVAEAVTAAGLNHPNVVSVYDVEESAGAAFIAMELIEGFSLESYLERRGSLTCEQTLLVGLAIARALAAAHTHGILHRDIKPGNVLLGYDESIKVADFGLAELISSAALTPGIVFGTPGYISPEGISGQPATEQGDLFSLGVVLYECASGRQPFAVGGVRETFVATLRAPVQTLGDILPKSRALTPLSELTAELMQRDAKERPATAARVVERLELVTRYYGLQWQLDLEAQTNVADGTRRSRSLMPTVVMESQQ